MKKLAVFSACVAAFGATLSVAGNWLPTPAGSPAGLIQRLERAHWVGTGAKSSAHVIYVFTDPNCPYCNDLWKAMKTADAADIQVRNLLVAVINEDSRGKDAAILESPDPAATLEKHERAYDKGGVKSKATVQPATGEIISTNEALMQALHIYGTPGIVYQDAHGEVRVFGGMPDAALLRWGC